MSQADGTDALVVMTTVETPEQGRAIANHLITVRLAACVQILPPMTSIYHWQGRVEEASETLLLVKTTRRCYAELEETIRQLHPYQTPEILALPVVAGGRGYLDWLEAETTLTTRDSPLTSPS
jgi:periplasmic divalent cation tolerance protein